MHCCQFPTTARCVLLLFITTIPYLHRIQESENEQTTQVAKPLPIACLQIGDKAATTVASCIMHCEYVRGTDKSGFRWRPAYCKHTVCTSTEARATSKLASHIPCSVITDGCLLTNSGHIVRTWSWPEPYIHRVYTVLLARNPSYSRSYTACVYGSGQTYVHVNWSRATTKLAIHISCSVNFDGGLLTNFGHTVRTATGARTATNLTCYHRGNCGAC
jgi:hypothetical protein